MQAKLKIFPILEKREREDNSVLSTLKIKSPNISKIIFKIAAFLFLWETLKSSFLLLLLKR